MHSAPGTAEVVASSSTEAERSPVTGENEFKAELSALWTALKKLAASLMWRTANAAATSAAITAACTERLPERTTEQIEVTPLLQTPASQVTGSLLRLDETDAVVYPQVCQEQYAAGETNRNRVDAPTVKLLERVQRRAVEQSASSIERLEEFDKRLEMSEARRAEIVVLWEERKRQEGLSGGFEPTDDDQRCSRESSKKKKKRNLNRTVQVLEQIPEHTVASSDQESLIGCNTTGGLVDGMMQCRTANVYKSP